MGLIESITDKLKNKGPDTEGSSGAGRAQRSGKKIREPPQQGGPQNANRGRDPQNTGPQGTGPQGSENQSPARNGPGPDSPDRPGGPPPGPGTGPQNDFDQPDQFDEPKALGADPGQGGFDEPGFDNGPGPDRPQDPGKGPGNEPGRPNSRGQDHQDMGRDSGMDMKQPPNFERGKDTSPSTGPGMQRQNRGQQQQPQQQRPPRQQSQGPRGRNEPEEPPAPTHYNLDLPAEGEGGEGGEIRTELQQIMRQNERIIDLLEQIRDRR